MGFAWGLHGFSKAKPVCLLENRVFDKQQNPKQGLSFAPLILKGSLVQQTPIGKDEQRPLPLAILLGPLKCVSVCVCVFCLTTSPCFGGRPRISLTASPAKLPGCKCQLPLGPVLMPLFLPQIFGQLGLPRWRQFGCGSKLNRRSYTGFESMFPLTIVPVWYRFLRAAIWVCVVFVWKVPCLVLVSRETKRKPTILGWP